MLEDRVGGLILLAGAALFGAFLALAPAPASAAADCTDGTVTCVIITAPEPLTPQQQAEEDRKARERALKAAARKRLVNEQVRRLGGEHRRAEAERFVAMQERAEAARPKPISATAGPAVAGMPTRGSDQDLYYRAAPCTQIPAGLRAGYGCGDGVARSGKVTAQ